MMKEAYFGFMICLEKVCDTAKWLDGDVFCRAKVYWANLMNSFLSLQNLYALHCQAALNSYMLSPVPCCCSRNGDKTAALEETLSFHW